MKNISRLFLFGASALVLLTAACAGQQGSPTPLIQTPFGLTASPAPLETETAETAATEPITTGTAATETSTTAVGLTGTVTTLTPGVPVTGGNIVLLECQFCIDTFAHALLVLPETATFKILTPAAVVSGSTETNTGCKTVDTFEGRQVVLCRAPENTSMNMTVCDNGNCQQLTIQLQSCPQSKAGTPASSGPTNAPGAAGAATSTSTPAALSTDTPAAPPATAPPTTAPPTATP